MMTRLELALVRPETTGCDLVLVHGHIPKVRFLGSDALHGLVVRVEVRVIVDLQRDRAESRGQL